MEHSAMVLLFDRDGKFVGTISPDEPDADALAKLEALSPSAGTRRRRHFSERWLPTGPTRKS